MSEDNLLKFLVELATNDDQRARFSDPTTKKQSMDLAELTEDEQSAINTGDFFTVRRQLGLQDDVPFNQSGHSPAPPSATGAASATKTAKKAAKAAKAGKKAAKAAKNAAKPARKAAKKAVKKAAKAAKKTGGRKR
jgi:hypothetical protein